MCYSVGGSSLEVKKKQPEYSLSTSEVVSSLAGIVSGN